VNDNPLPGANITLTGTNYGAEADEDGYYFIIGVRAGKYDIKCDYIGYDSQEIKDINVKAGLTLSQNFRLNSGVIELEEIGVVVAIEQKVEKDVTTSMRSIDLGHIDKFAMTDVEGVLKSTAGIKTGADGELHFRGGRSGEVNYIIDGIMIGDPTGAKTNPVDINFANVESFNILKGIPDAEYGDALSGSVNIILKTGDQEKTSGHVKYETDAFFGENTLKYDRGEFSLSGPIPFSINGNKPTYFIGTDLTLQNGLAESYRIKGDSDGEYFKFKDHDLTGLGFEMLQRRENFFNLILKGAYDINPTIRLSASYMKSREHGIEYDYHYRYTPETATETISDVSVLNLTWRHNINRSSYYDLIFSRYNRQYEKLPGGKKPGEFVLSDNTDRFIADYSDPSRNNDIIRNRVRDGGQAEGYIDTNQNGYFDREYYQDNSGSGYYDPDKGDIFYPFDPAYDSNMNGQWDGDRLYDSNANGLWDYWEKGTAYSGFNGDCLIGEIVEGYYDNNISGNYEADIYTAQNSVPGTDEPYVDGDSFNDTGEPFVDQRKFRNVLINNEETIQELPNGIWDPQSASEIKIYTVRENSDLGIEEIHKDIRPINFYERVDHHINSPFYQADTLYYRMSTGKTVVINSITYDLVDQYIRFIYKEEDFANLKSSLGSLTQDIPRVNNIYNGRENGIFDEFEAYSSYRPYGSSTAENDLGWKSDQDYYEYVGSYVVFKVPKHLYEILPNLKNITHNEYSTWTNRNPEINNTYDPSNGTYDHGEEFTDYNYNNVWNSNSGFLLKGQYLDGITYSLLNNTVTKLKGSYTNQIDKFHMMKTGFELVLNDFDYYSVVNPYTTYDTEQYGVSDGDPYPERGREKTVYNYKPKEFSSFIQDKMEFEDLVVNAGVRLDMRILDDEAVNDYQEKYEQGVNGYEEEIDKIKAVVSPRVGISHSISETSKLFFSYGHLYQLPQYTLIFDTNTKAVANPLFGNMNLGYERNVQYELGVVNQMGNYLIDITGYFKDIFDMINTKTYTSTISDDASVFVNSDYGKSRGIELTIDRSLKDNYMWSFSYTLSYAYGKSSSQTSNFEDEELLIKEFPLDWDETHSFNSYFALVYDKNETIFNLPYTDDWTLSVTTDFGSGKPFTPSVDYYDSDIDPRKIITNSERLPWTSNTDLKFVKKFGKLRLEFNVFNLFDKINVKSVYSDTGTWNSRSDAFYAGEGNSNLVEIFRNPSNIEERRHYKFGVSYLW
jgi:outer membrane receptor protein involved in Fe transport